ncbi:hypothetical protein ACPOLB_09785 [Rubrivivax sp. RP6-9]|uniref:hypothetical protein n=1 Tax=Rubrivivax sp. RP6-9 TaxID=3415750 RepID=UPI003CC586E0
MRVASIAFAAAAAMLLGACTEQPQTAGTRKADGSVYQPAKSAFVAPGWTAGDAASWEEQTRRRTQGQNEYSRAPAAGQ